MNASPINARERIVSLDIIRGFALFGIFLANIPHFQWPVIQAQLYALPIEYAAADRWIRMLFDMFIETKFFSIFSFLFGLGFYLFMQRAEEKGFRVYRLFTRRLIVLALFGLLHLVFLWYGDILLTYACAGFLLMLFYKCKPKTIVIWMVAMMSFIMLIMAINFLVLPETLELLIIELQAEGADKIEAAIDTYQHATYWTWLSYRFANEVIPILKDLPSSMLVAFFMFLVGLYAGKRGYFSAVEQHLPFIKRVCWITAVIGLPMTITVMLLHIGVLDDGASLDFKIQMITLLSGPLIAMFYISAILLLLRQQRWHRWLRPFGSAGRMALTNYIMQTCVGVGIFTGLGYFGVLNLRAGILLCFIVFLLQIVFSHYWLQRYRFGPLEWVWRTLTYGNVQPLKVQRMSAEQ